MNLDETTDKVSIWSYVRLAALGFLLTPSLWLIASSLPQEQIWRITPVAVLLSLLTVSEVFSTKLKYRTIVVIVPVLVTAIIIRFAT